MTHELKIKWLKLAPASEEGHNISGFVITRQLKYFKFAFPN